MEPDLAQVSEHLEFLGYTIEAQLEDVFHASHATKPNLTVRAWLGGFLLTAWYGTTAESLVNREGFLETINLLNEKAVVSRYYVDQEYDFAAEAFYHPPYERAAFARFMELWDHDFARVRDSDIEQFLG